MHEHFELSESVDTLAERLRRRGYETAGFTCNPWLHAHSGIEQGFDTYIEVYKHDAGEPDKGAQMATKLAVRWLERRTQPSQPFLLFVNYMEAHLPYEPPADSLDRLAPSSTTTAWRSFSIEQAEKYIAGTDRLTEDDLAEVQRLYYAEVSYLDQQIAVLLDFLRAHGQLDNTILIVTSDHGEHLGEHALMGHEFTLFDPVLRIPLVLRYPGVFRAGGEIKTPVSLIDILPTVLDVLNTDDARSAVDGCSLLATRGSPVESDRPLLFEYARPVTLINKYWHTKHPDVDMSRYDVSLRGLRHGVFKYIVAGDDTERLYDLANDPGEQTNIADHSPDVVSELRDELSEMTARP